MAEYIVQWNYGSSYGGPWTAGETVNLDEQRAADINRDSPGVLLPKVEMRAVDAPPQDRMVKAPGRKRGAVIRCSYCKEEFGTAAERDAHEPACEKRPANHGAIGRESFKAMKPKG